MDLLTQVIIALITTTLGSVLAYLKAVKESNIKIESIRINANNEIQKIREESEKELNKIKTESEEKIKAKLVEAELESKKQEEEIKYEAMKPFFQEILKDPKKAKNTINELQKLQEMFPNINNN